MASKSGLKIISTFGMCLGKLALLVQDIAREAYANGEGESDETRKVFYIIENARKKLQVAVDAWSIQLDRRDMKRVSIAMKEYEKYLGGSHVVQFLSVGLALLEDIRVHIRDPTRLKKLEDAISAYSAVHLIFDDGLDHDDDYTRADLNVRRWNMILSA